MTPAQLHSTAVPELDAATGEESGAAPEQDDGQGQSESEEEEAPAHDAARVPNGVAAAKA